MYYLVIKNVKNGLLKFVSQADMDELDFYRTYTFYNFKCKGYSAKLCTYDFK